MTEKEKEIGLNKAQIPIELTELGIVTVVSPEQPKNAACSLVVTELGIVKDVSPVQLSKA